LARITVGISGGVDSAVAALLLKRQGHEVTGVFMRNWKEQKGKCPALEDFDDARRACDHIGIPCYGADFSADFRGVVFAHFLKELQAGRTPNPDVLCNTHIKFKAFLDYALTGGAELIATGHYAGALQENGQSILLRARDENKDQTYFLHGLNQNQLAKTVFPLAEYTKPQVRQIAAGAGLPVAEKKDSTGLCFIGERDFRKFVKQFLPTIPGDIITTDNKVVGRHEGLAFYTVGQRRGLKIGGVQGGEGRWFVIDKDLNKNQLTVNCGDTPLLYKNEIATEQAHFIAGAPPAQKFQAMARIRHRQPLQHCDVEVLPDGTAHIIFINPQRAVAPGQSIVWYDNQVCLGGAVIKGR